MFTKKMNSIETLVQEEAELQDQKKVKIFQTRK